MKVSTQNYLKKNKTIATLLINFFKVATLPYPTFTLMLNLLCPQKKILNMSRGYFYFFLIFFLDKVNLKCNNVIMKQRRLSEKDFIKLYKELNINELAYYCGVNRVTIYRWAKKLKLPLKQNLPLIKNDRMDKTT